MLYERTNKTLSAYGRDSGRIECPSVRACCNESKLEFLLGVPLRDDGLSSSNYAVDPEEPLRATEIPATL